MSERFTHNGHTFTITTERDEFMGPPWTEHDGHGIVSDWTTRPKAPGERVLVEDYAGRSRRYYDVRASMQIALRDGWDAAPYHAANPTETKRQQAARAVEADFEYLRRWCHDEWEWIAVTVRLAGVDGDFRASLGGIDGADPEYLEQVRIELAEEALHEYEATPKCAHCGQVLRTDEARQRVRA